MNKSPHIITVRADEILLVWESVMSENTTTAVNETANNPSNYWKNNFVRDDFVEYIPTNLSAYQAIEKNADEFADLRHARIVLRFEEHAVLGA